MFIDSTFQVCQGSITAVCLSVQSLKLCEAVKFTGSVIVSRYHTVENFKMNESQERKVRSIMCNRVVSVNSVSNICRKCQNMTLGQFQGQSQKENITRAPQEIKPVNSEVNSKPNVLTKEDIKISFQTQMMKWLNFYKAKHKI